MERLAPELKASRWSRVGVVGLALAIVALATGGMIGGLYMTDRAPGTTQLEYHSTEQFGQGPGARLFYHPELKAVVMRGWLLPALGDAGVYHLWAIDSRGDYRSVASKDADEWVGLTIVSERDLSDTERYVLTREAPGGSLSQPQGQKLLELVRFR